MPFPRRLLSEGEDVVIELRPHWTALGWVPPLFVAVAAGLIALAVAWPSAPVAIGYAGLAVLVAVGCSLAIRLLKWRRSALVVTTTRLVRRSGVLARRGLEIRLVRVNEISYDQSILERILGSGRLLVEVGGETGVIAFDHVRRPAAVAAVLHEQLAELGGTGGARSSTGGGGGGAGRWAPAPQARPQDTPPHGLAAGPPRPLGGERSVAERLIELDELRRRGILSEAEFAAKRAALIDRL